MFREPTFRVVLRLEPILNFNILCLHQISSFSKDVKLSILRAFIDRQEEP